MNTIDDKLKALLSQWRGLSPKAGFEADVWRRIREPSLERAGWLNQITGWLASQPAWANAVAALAGVAIGAAAGLGPVSNRQEVAILKPGTLTGNYVSMISGGAR